MLSEHLFRYFSFRYVTIFVNRSTKPFKETYESLSYQGFPSGDSDFTNTFLNAESDDMEHFFIREHFTMGYESNALFRHTIDTSQIAVVSNRKTQVIDDSVVVSQQWESSERSAFQTRLEY